MGVMVGAPARIGVVGLGTWGRNHALVFSDYDRSRLVVVCDADASRAKSVAAEFRCDWTTDAAEVAGGDVDAVGIATPDFAHFAVAREALAHGKHVLVEKPLTTSSTEARQLVEAAERSGVWGMVDFHLRWHPKWMMIKDAVESGEIGPLSMGYLRLSDGIRVATHWLSWAGRSGPEWFLLPHIVDLVRWIWATEPAWVAAAGRRGVLQRAGVDVWDSLQVMLGFDDSFVTLETSWIVPDSHPSVTDTAATIYGESGRIEFEQDVEGLAFERKSYERPWVPAGRRDRAGKLNHFIYDSIRYFVDCVVDGTAPSVSLTDGLANVLIVEAALRAIEQGQRVRL